MPKGKNLTVKQKTLVKKQYPKLDPDSYLLIRHCTPEKTITIKHKTSDAEYLVKL